MSEFVTSAVGYWKNTFLHCFTFFIGIPNIDFSWQSEKPENVAFCGSRVNSIFRRPSELTETSHISTISECVLPKSCVKLVDCGKFPWYFKKYTQQILDKTRLNLDSESDSELDDVDVEDSNLDDCFIVENLPAVQNESLKCQHNKTLAIMMRTKLELSKTALEKRQETIKRKEDIEIRRALSMKNIAKVDFKRNQGLVGMKISQKIVKNVALDITTARSNEVKVTEKKQNDIVINETYINAADKVLGHIGTQLIPIPKNDMSFPLIAKTKEEGKILIHEQVKITDKSITSKKVPVQLSLCKISEKLFDNIKEKKIRDSVSEHKMKSKVSNKSLFKCPEKHLTVANNKESESKMNVIVNSPNKSSLHIKDGKETNKYKNDQMNNENNADSGADKELLIIKTSKVDNNNFKHAKPTKHELEDVKQNKVVDLTKTQYKKVEKRKLEPKSPILPCSTLLKKSKVRQEMPSEYNISNVNVKISQEVDNLNKKADKLANVESKGSKDDKKIKLNSESAIDTPSHKHVKQYLQKDKTILHDKNVRPLNDVAALSTKIADEKIYNCNEKHKNNFKITNPIEQSNLMSDAYQHKDNTHSIKIVSVASMATPVKNIKPNLVNEKDIPRAIVIKPVNQSQNEPKTANVSNKYNNFNPVKNSSYYTTSQGNIPNNNVNVPVNITLTPNHQTNFKVGNHIPERSSQTRCAERPTSMPFPINTQPWFWNYPNPSPGYYQSAPFGRYQNYLPRSVNRSVPNKFPPPKDIESICRQLSNQTQNRYAYKGWYPHNTAPPPPPPPPPPPLPPPPPPPLNTPPRTTNDRDVNQNRYCSYANPPFYPSMTVSQQPQDSFNHNMTHILQPKNNSLFGRNNNDIVKNDFAAVSESKKDDNKEGTVKVEVDFKDVQIIPDEMSEVVSTKTKMLEELDKLSFTDDTDITNDLNRRYHDSSKLEMEVISKKPKTFETLRITVNDKSYDAKIEKSKGYSPPILPIPTYEKVLDQIAQSQNEKSQNIDHKTETKCIIKNEMKPVKKRNYEKSCKNILPEEFNNRPQTINLLTTAERKDDAKKISLEEYKKRIFKNDSRVVTNSDNKCREKSKNCRKRQYLDKYRENVDYSTETDLGYDSDSTVVL